MTTHEDEFALEFSDDVEELARAAEQLTAGNAEPPTLQDPLDGPVELPAGFRRLTLREDKTVTEEVRKAWVRELNGEDEERIAKAKLKHDQSAFVDAILEAGIERLGNEKPTRDDISALVLGDRDFLLLEISRVTFGNDLDYEGFICMHCGGEISFTVHLDEDVPVKRLDKVSDVDFEIRLKGDRVASVTLPTGEDVAEVSEAATEAEANTLLIAAAVNEIRGPGSKVVSIKGDHDAARRLSLPDRRTLIKEMSEHMPGPQYNEVKFTHEDDSCGKEVRLTVTLADLFPGL